MTLFVLIYFEPPTQCPINKVKNTYKQMREKGRGEIEVLWEFYVILWSLI